MAKERIGAQQASETLNKNFPEVTWDRYVDNELDIGFTMYGWIDREGDSYKDFITVTFDDFGDYFFVTSSAKYSKIFGKRINPTGTHTDCKRVEESFPALKNVVRLNK